MAPRLFLKRYYVHGDLSEDTPGTYFCAICDSFESRVHFDDTEHVEKRAEWYTRKLESWKNRGSRKEARRPANAENILAAAANDDIKKAKESRSPFYRWLLKQVERDDLVGDLARDVKDDRGFPFAVRAKKEIESYLSWKSGRQKVLEAFKEAWSEFRPRRVPRKIAGRE